MISRDQTIRTKPMRTDKVCRELDFYSITIDNSRSLAVEHFLDEAIESPCRAAFDDVLSGNFPPRPEARRAIATFVAFQALRGYEPRAALGQIVEYISKVVQHRINDLREARPTFNPVTPASDKPRPGLASATSWSGLSAEEIQTDSIMAMMGMAPRLAHMVSARRWFIFDHAEPCLITSDTPVVRMSLPQQMNSYGVSFANADILALPISSQRSLMMIYETPAAERLIQLGGISGPELAQSLNLQVAANSFRWFFHHPDIDPLKGVSLPPRLPSLQIG